VNQWETCGNWEVGKEKTRALEYTNDGQVRMYRTQAVWHESNNFVGTVLTHARKFSINIKKIFEFSKKALLFS
jgi:hypothetical protein